MAMKIDIRKAFDTLTWSFLLLVFKSFGFFETFCRWISTILEPARISMLVNGFSVGYFPCSRGFRQRNLLSPILFSLAKDSLSRLLFNLIQEGAILPMHVGQDIAVPTHFSYADDILLICRASKSNLRALLEVFQDYGRLSN